MDHVRMLKGVLMRSFQSNYMYYHKKEEQGRASEALLAMSSLGLAKK